MWLRTLLLLILVLLLVRALMRLLGGVVQGVSGSERARHRHARPPVKMVADPVCGTFVVPGKALQLARGRETLYFCSEKCRDQWTASR